MTNDTKSYNYIKITSTYPIDDDIVEINGVKYRRVVEEPTPKPQTLLEIIREWNDDDDNPPCEILVDMIERWMTQYECDYVVCAEYLQGYNALMETLKENLK